MKNFKHIAIISIIVVFFLFYMVEQESIPVEELATPIASAVDIDKQSEEEKKYIITYNMYNYGTGNFYSSFNAQIKNRVIASGREERQLKINKSYRVDSNVLIISEELAKSGLKEVIDINFSNPTVNDKATVFICKGKGKDILSYKIEGYASAGEYLEYVLENSPEYKGIAQKYDLLHVLINNTNEGKNIVLPYIELSEQGIKLTGMAVFSKDKMLYKVPYEESKLLTLMRYNNAKGNISLMDSQEKYIDYYINSSKRNIKCYKDNRGKLNFHITLTVKGTIESNTTNKDIDYKLSKNIEARVTEKLEEQCNKIIKDMQNKYIIDFLQLGSVAAAKYGREKNIDWDKEISNSKIEVKVKAKVEKVGRGKY